MEAARQIAETFGLNWGTFIPYLINFALILVVLRLFAYKPILAMLEERRKIIADSMKQAEQIKEELAKTQAARDEILTKANATAERMISEARQAAEKFHDQKLNETLKQAEEVLRKAQQSAGAEREHVMAELRREMVSLVVATTARVAGKVLTAGMDPEELDQLLDELEETATAKGEKFDRKALLDEIGRARNQGYHVSLGERMEGTFAVAAPVVANRRTIAAATVSGSADKLTPKKIERLIIEVRDAAQAITERYEV